MVWFQVFPNSAAHWDHFLSLILSKTHLLNWLCWDLNLGLMVWMLTLTTQPHIHVLYKLCHTLYLLVLLILSFMAERIHCWSIQTLFIFTVWILCVHTNTWIFTKCWKILKLLKKICGSNWFFYWKHLVQIIIDVAKENICMTSSEKIF